MAFSQASSFGRLSGTGPDRADVLRRLDMLAQLMDNAFLIPGTNRRVGLDALIGLVPGIGDAVTTVVQSYIIWEARRLGVPKRVLARMVGNVALDGLVGLVPFLGDAFDAVFKANVRNVRLLQEYLASTDSELSRPARSGSAGAGDVIDADYTVVGGRR